MGSTPRELRTPFFINVVRKRKLLTLNLTVMASTLGAAVGPFLGGLIADQSTWRWVFYLNVPLGGLAFIALFIFLRLHHQRDQTWKQRLARIDVVGNAIFIGAIVAVLIALTWGGTVYSWSTSRIIVPIVLGFIGLGLYIAFEWTWSKEPSFPRKVVSNRTSAVALLLTLLHALCTYWCFYFLPIYFQSVKGFSSMWSGTWVVSSLLICSLVPSTLAPSYSPPTDIAHQLSSGAPSRFLEFSKVTPMCGS